MGEVPLGRRERQIVEAVYRLEEASVSDVLRGTLRSYLAPLGEPFAWDPTSFEYFGRGAIYLVLASPEYQLQ